jgi:hypothetical protein
MAEVSSNSLVLNFLNLIGQWDYNVPPTTQWAVAIVPESSEYGGSYSFFSILKEYTQLDNYGFYIPTSIQNRLLNNKVQPNIDNIGLYFAQSIKIPKEGFNPNFIGIEGMSGYLKGVVGGDRLDMGSRNLSIDFLETNLDFVDGLIRPWIITASYMGLINRGMRRSIKATITVQEFGSQNSFEDKPVRKIHIFSGCVPSDTGSKTLKYDSSEILINTVNWIYNTYTYQLVPY